MNDKTKMTDQEHANDIRECVQALRDAVVSARQDGLTVLVPIFLTQWLDSGHPPGEPEKWEIKRHSL